MKSLYNKIYKNYQVNMGNPYQINQYAQILKAKKNVEPEDQDQNEDESGFKKGPSPEEIMAHAQEQADLIRQEAEFEAQRMLEHAQKEIEQKTDEMLYNAYNEGYAKGEEDAKQQYEDILREAEFIREHAKSEYNDVLRGIEMDALSMIMEIAKKVVSSEIQQNQECILEMIQDTFENCSNREDIVLKVSSDDFDFVKASEALLLSRLEGVETLIIKKDHALKKGSCIIDTKFGTADGSWETKYQLIQSAYNKLLGLE